MDLLYRKRNSDKGFDYYIIDVDYFAANNSVALDSALSYRPGVPIVWDSLISISRHNLARYRGMGIAESVLRVVDPGRASEIVRCAMICENLSQLSNPRGLIRICPNHPTNGS